MDKKYYIAPMEKETLVDIEACILSPSEGGGEGVGGGEED